MVCSEKAYVNEEYFRFYHMQDCCERVKIYKIKGDIYSLINRPIIECTETILDNKDPDDLILDQEDIRYRESFTWTIYTFKTQQDEVTIYWLGESNGYYGERVCFSRANK